MKKVSVLCVLDRSGSMSMLASDVIGGYNEFIEKQKESGSDVSVTTVIFDTEYEVLYANKPIEDVPVLSEEQYYARGATALYDALGKGVNELGNELSNTAESDRPEKVIVVVMTDGMENSSKEFNLEQTKAMLEHQRTKYSWEFLFLCAGEDQLEAGLHMGFNPNHISVYAHDSKGITSSLRSVGDAVYLASAGGNIGTMDFQEVYNKNESEV